MNAKQRRTFKRAHHPRLGDVVRVAPTLGVWVVLHSPKQGFVTLIAASPAAADHSRHPILRSNWLQFRRIRRLPDHQITLIHLGALDALQQQLLKEQESLP